MLPVVLTSRARDTLSIIRSSPRYLRWTLLAGLVLATMLAGPGTETAKADHGWIPGLPFCIDSGDSLCNHETGTSGGGGPHVESDVTYSGYLLRPYQDLRGLNYSTAFAAGSPPHYLREHWFNEFCLDHANLEGADLSYTRTEFTKSCGTRANLDGANLTNSTLIGIYWPDAALHEANLSGAILTGKANLAGANLYGADLTGKADLTGAILTDTNLTDANLTGANLTGADLTGAVLTGANLTGADLTGATLTGASLYLADLSNAILTDAVLIDVDLSVTKLNGVTSGGIITGPTGLPTRQFWKLVNGFLVGYGANLRGADLSNANLRGVGLSNADLTDAILTNANLTEVSLAGAVLTRADLTGATLPGMDVTGATLTGANLTGTTMMALKWYAGQDGRGELDAYPDPAVDRIKSGGIIGAPSHLPSGWKVINGFLVGTGADLSGADLSGADLSGLNLTFAYLTDAELDGAIFNGTTLTGARLGGAKMGNANLNGVKSPYVANGPRSSSFSNFGDAPDSLPFNWGFERIGNYLYKIDAMAPVWTVPATLAPACRGAMRACGFTVTADPGGVTTSFNYWGATFDVYEHGIWGTAQFHVSDNVGVVFSECTPGGHLLWYVGTTTVNCSAWDAGGNVGYATFDVIVLDGEAPTWNVPDYIQVNTAPGLPSAVVFFPNYPDWPKDNVGVTSRSCTPDAYSTFLVGTTTVNCTAQDAAGNIGTASFDVTVVDNEKPLVVAPVVPAVEATHATGTVVSWDSPAVTDNVGVTSSSCAPASGSTFAVGATTVTCKAEDAAGNVGTASFDVTVKDTTDPLLSVDEVVAASDGLYPSESFTLFPATVGSLSVTLNGTASDIVGVTSVTVNGVSASYDSPTGNWSLSGIAMPPPGGSLDVVASDDAGNTTSISKIVLFDSDVDDDGIANNVDGDCDGTTAYSTAGNLSFSDLQRGGLTCGVIVSDGGHGLVITDSADPADGVHVEVEANAGPDVKLQIAGKASTIFLAAGTVAEVTDPDTTTTVYVVSGSATMELMVAGVPVVIAVPEGATATITETTNADGTVYSLDIDVDGEVTVNGTDASSGLEILAPTDKDQCKNNGWKAFNFPRLFKNQGQCIQFVNTGK